MDKTQSTKETYIPTELNTVFWKASKHILKSFKFFESSYKAEPRKPVDYSLFEGQIGIILEKFAHDLLKSLALSKTKFAKLPAIQRNVQIDNPEALSFIKQTELPGSDEDDFLEDRLAFQVIPDIEYTTVTAKGLTVNNVPSETHAEITKLKQKVAQSTETINKMRYDFLKELQLLREMVYRKEHLGDDFEYMDIYFFSPTSELDEKACLALNSKLKEVVSQFNAKLALLKKTNDLLQRNIQNYDKFNADTPGLFSYHEINADGIVQKLALVEDNPRNIWQAFDKHYGHAFFLDVIREEFGLIPKVNNQIEKQFNEKLLEYQKQAMDQVNKLVERYHKEITHLREELKKKGDTIEEMNRNHAVELEQMRNEVEKAFKIKMREQEDVIKTIFYSEKEGLTRRISELETLVAELSNNKITNKLRLRLAIRKWAYLNKLRTVANTKGLGEMKRQIKDTCDFIGEKYQTQLEKAKREAYVSAKEAIEEKSKVLLEYGELRYENQILAQQVSMFKRKLKMGEIAYTDLTRELINAQEELRGIESDSNNLKKSYDAAQDYIKSLEKELFEYEQVLKHIPKVKIATISKQATDSERKEKRAINELNALAISQLKSVKGDKVQDSSTLTELFGVEKTIGIMEEVFQRLYKEVGITVAPETKEYEMNTEYNEKVEAEILTDVYGEQNEVVVEEKKETIECETQYQWKENFVEHSVVEESIIVEAKPKACPQENEKDSDVEEDNVKMEDLDLLHSSPPKRSEREFKRQNTLDKKSSKHSDRSLSGLDSAAKEEAKYAEDAENAYIDLSPGENTRSHKSIKSRTGSKIVFNNDSALPKPSTPSELLNNSSPTSEIQGLMRLIENSNDETEQALLEKQKEQLKAIQEASELPTFDARTLKRICPLCKKERQNMRRPIIKVAPYNIHGLENIINRRLGISNHQHKAVQTEYDSSEATLRPAKTASTNHRRAFSRSEGRSKRKIFKDPMSGADTSLHKNHASDFQNASVCIDSKDLLKDAKAKGKGSVNVLEMNYEPLEPVTSGYAVPGKRTSSLLWKQKIIQDARRKKILSRGKIGSFAVQNSGK